MNRAQGAWKVADCQSARGTARRTISKTITTGRTPVPYQERWRCAGARLSLWFAVMSQTTANVSQQAAMLTAALIAPSPAGRIVGGRG
ncbi:MAG: hypothetical protein ACRDPO_18035 [Streptosporangiaceae bacterium]